MPLRASSPFDHIVINSVLLTKVGIYYEEIIYWSMQVLTRYLSTRLVICVRIFRLGIFKSSS